jgi:site-specific recombinase XerD
MIRDVLNRYSEGEALCGLQRSKTGRKRSPATVNRKRACLSSLFKFAIKEQGYLTENPVRLVPSHTENKKRTRFLTDEERTALLTACRESERGVYAKTLKYVPQPDSEQGAFSDVKSCYFRPIDVAN